VQLSVPIHPESLSNAQGFLGPPITTGEHPLISPD
jgi:hypothetical protein